MNVNLKGHGKATLDYLVGHLSKDYETTVSDLKKAGAYAAGHARPYVIGGLAFLMLAAYTGCPWQKKNRDRDTTSGSSGQINSAPTLFEDGVEPNKGKPSTNIVFKVEYADADNDAPTSIKAVAKNQADAETEFPMIVGTNPATSTYVTGKQFTTGNVNLPVGMYTFKFEASDGKAITSTSYSNNLEIVANSTPTLESLVDAQFDDGVEPNDGKASTNIVFKVIYTDANNDAPASIKAVAKNQNNVETELQMIEDANPATSTYVTGKKFTTGNVNLPTGMYTFKFEASDGEATTSTNYANNLTILSDDANAALEKRFSYQGIFANAAGTKAATVNAQGESDGFLKWLATSNDVNARKARNILYDAEVRSGNNVLLAGNSATRDQYHTLLKFFFDSWTDGVVDNQTSSPAPAPLEVLVSNLEIDNLISGSGYGIAFDKTNKKIRFYLKNKAGGELALTYDLTNEEMPVITGMFRTSLAGTYWKNENTYSYNVFFDNGEQVKQTDLE